MNLKRIKILGYGFLFSIALGMTSCELATLDEPTAEGEQGEEQEEERVTGPTTRPAAAEFEQLFHGGSEKVWAGEAFTLAGFNGFQDCRLDDQITINSDGTYLYDGGNTLCGAEDNEQTRNGTWRIINDGENIIFDEGTNREYQADVVGLVQDSITLSGDYLGLEINGLYIAQ